MEPFRQSMRPRSGVAGAENILRIGRGEQPQANSITRDAELSRKGQAALDLVSQVADTISQTENRIETLLVRALEQLKTMEDRNRLLADMFNSANDRVSCLFNRGLQRSHHTQRLFGFVLDQLLHSPAQRHSVI